MRASHAALLLLIVAVALMLMSRGGKKPKAVPIEATQPALGVSTGSGGSPEPEYAGVPGGAIDSSIPPDVLTLVQRQPEEIAVLLRGWLADRR